ncbi:MAG: gamma-glutamyl-phosphate reductase, partial [Flavobacteriaceae bacterium]|nr:gamma-glutamyl-phosphate reductase [Flavobacteriaceae bacterium]
MTSEYQNTFRLAAEACKSLNLLSEEEINAILESIAEETEASIADILSENRKDLARMDSSNPKYDR